MTALEACGATIARRSCATCHAGRKLHWTSATSLAGQLSSMGSASSTWPQLHHDVFLEVLRDSQSDDLTRVATAASEFFLEALATYDMAQRGFPRET